MVRLLYTSVRPQNMLKNLLASSAVISFGRILAPWFESNRAVEFILTDDSYSIPALSSKDFRYWFSFLGVQFCFVVLGYHSYIFILII